MSRLYPQALLTAVLLGAVGDAEAEARYVQTPYAPPKVVLDIYLDDPAKLGATLYWLRGILLPPVGATL